MICVRTKKIAVDSGKVTMRIKVAEKLKIDIPNELVYNAEIIND